MWGGRTVETAVDDNIAIQRAVEVAHEVEVVELGSIAHGVVYTALGTEADDYDSHWWAVELGQAEGELRKGQR